MDNSAKLRSLYLARILYQKTDEEHFLSTAELISILKREYGISAHRQTIKTDIELLQKFGFDIQEIKSTQNRYNMYARNFDTAELVLLIDAVASSKFITQAKSKDLIDKLTLLTSDHIAKSLKRNVSCNGRVKSANERAYLIVDTINEAINNSKKISFFYFQYNVKKERKLRHNGEPYIITPLHLVWSGDCYYMIGIYDSNQQIRIFRVDRIAKCPVILQENGALPPNDFQIDDYINTSFRMYNGDQQEVELVCDNTVMDSIIDRFGEEVVTYANDMTSFRAIVKVAVSHVFYSWVFGFEGKVKIKKPESVRKKYMEMLHTAIDHCQ